MPSKPSANTVRSKDFICPYAAFYDAIRGAEAAMTPYHEHMNTYLNIHTHRPPASPTETVIRNYILHDVPYEQEKATPRESFSAGIHPWYVPAHPETALEELARLAALPACKAIGETGPDKFAAAPMPLQCNLFLRQAELAANHRLPLIIHCVRAWDKLFAMQKEMPAGLTCIIHGFRGKPELAGSLLHHGFYLSFGFHFHPQSLSLCPPERLFLETDEDRRHVEVLYHKAAALHACSPDSLRIQCHKNFERITAPSKK